MASGSPRPDPQISEPHLSESQIDDCIIGDLAPAPSAHLSVCSHCAQRVAAAAAPLTSFQTLSITWSERLSAGLPPPRHSPPKPVWQRHLAFAAPCLVLVIGLTVLHSTYANNAAPQSAQPNPTADSLAVDNATVASRQSHVSADDQMLNAIEADFNPDSDSPADLGLRPVSDTSPSTPSSVQD